MRRLWSQPGHGMMPRHQGCCQAAQGILASRLLTGLNRAVHTLLTRHKLVRKCRCLNLRLQPAAVATWRSAAWQSRLSQQSCVQCEATMLIRQSPWFLSEVAQHRLLAGSSTLLAAQQLPSQLSLPSS